MATEAAPEIRFEGYSPGTEIWGSTQADFLVQSSGQHAKEAAILLNDPAAKMLAEASGREDTPEFREEAARVAGQVVLEELVGRTVSLDSIITVSKWYFELNPGALERVKAALAR